MAVLGISTDRPASQKKFVDKGGLPFPMLCDTDGTLTAAVGARGFGGFAKRVSFALDTDGRVSHTFGKVRPAGHAREVLEVLEALD